ncbi:MAG: hypothetical protein KUG82_11835 [Pseudomonadales bacterium]|nr:hypothetical protein [Pseudomonadales bacterium]
MSIMTNSLECISASFNRRPIEEMLHHPVKTWMCALVCTLAMMSLEGTAGELGGEKTNAMEEELAQAKLILVRAQDAADHLLYMAQQEASQIKNESNTDSIPDQNSKTKTISPLIVKNEVVAVELQSATIEEITNALMPIGWRVMVDVTDQRILARRFQFVTTKPRDQALAMFVKTVGLNYQYFFDLLDEKGDPVPLLVISEDMTR